MNMPKLRMVKNYDIGLIIAVAIALGVAGIVIAFNARILDSVADDMTENGTAWNATQDALSAQAELSSWLPLLAIIFVAAVIIGVLMTFGRTASGGRPF